MKTLFMMKGLPASGKSTIAKRMLADMGSGNIKRVNKDDLRAMLDDGKWSKENEKYVIDLRDHVITSALSMGKHVVVDDTNLAPKHEARLRDLARRCQAQFEVVDCTDVSVEECIERDRKRQNYVGESVIRGMYAQFLAKPVTAPDHDPNLPDAILVDVDGTVAQMNGRGPFDWGRVGEDIPRTVVIEIARKMWETSDAEIVFLSGRDSVCREETQKWLDFHFGNGSGLSLFMRPNGDMRKDAIVKQELYEQYILGKYNVKAIFEDRPQMIRCWQSLGFTDRIFNVGDGTEF